MCLRTGLTLTMVLMATALSGCQEDPFELKPPEDCEIVTQNDYVQRVMELAYLWNDELPEVEPEDYDSPKELLSDLKYSKYDKWSRISKKSTSDAYFMEGKYKGYGYRYKTGDDDEVRIASVYPDSPAEEAGLKRGDIIVSSESEGGVLVMKLEDQDGETRAVTMDKTWVTIVTVPIHKVLKHDGKKVGYLFFETFVKTSIDELDDAFEEFREQKIDEMVVDFRYNGGGLLSVAVHITDLLGGAVADGDTLYGIEYNDNLSDEDSERIFDEAKHSVELERVVFLTTGSTASASELVINSLRPFVETVVIGSNTTGKPVGSRSWSFCEQLLKPITFRLVNADGEGDYFDGMDPDCKAEDDLSHDLGDPEEASLQTALSYIENGKCPESSSKFGPSRTSSPRWEPDPDAEIPELAGSR